MIDREKIIKEFIDRISTCSMIGDGFDVTINWKLADDILALLKEQEPVKAVADGEDSYMCNNCGTVIGWTELDMSGIEEVKYKFCPECGRPVKWE